MKISIFLSLIPLCFGYQYNQRYNHWHAGTWQILPPSCDPYCFSNVDRFPVKIWMPSGSDCPDEIDSEDVKRSVYELDYEKACAGVNFFHGSNLRAQ